MKLLLVIAVTLVCVAYVAESKEEKCFKDVKSGWKAKIKERIEKKYKPVIDACKSENAKADDGEIKKCCKKKMKDAWDGCKSVKGGRKQCMQEKLHLEKTAQKNLTKEEIKEKIIANLINDSKKAAVNTAIAKCKDKDGREYWLCCLEEISNGPCPEVKKFADKIISWKKKWSDKKSESKKA